MHELRAKPWGVLAAFAVTTWGLTCLPAGAASLDKDGTIKLGLRTYVNARVGTENTDQTVVTEPSGNLLPPLNTTTLLAQTFPKSSAGHLRQNRFFLEAEFDHDLTKLLQAGFGPLALLKDLPFRVKDFKYHLTYRGEGEGVYDWGPQEYSSRAPFNEVMKDADGNFNPPNSCVPSGQSSCPDVDFKRKELRHQGVTRNRLYQAYIDVGAGDFFFRIGRQVLVWGESDNFRLLDNINPIDSSFGGFLTSLDERRVPLDMLRANYRLPSLGDAITEGTLEGYVAIDNKVSYYPGTADGAVWNLPNLGFPDGYPPNSQRNFIIRPPRSFQGARGGARLQFQAYDTTFSVAHYYTYADLPMVQSCVHPGIATEGFPIRKISTRDDVMATKFHNTIPGCPIQVFDLPIKQPTVCRPLPGGGFGPPGCRMPGTFEILAPTAYTVQLPAKMQVSGMSATTAVPSSWSRRLGLSGEPIVRTELAYLKDEPAQTQHQLDSFVYHSINNPVPAATGGTLQKDSISFLLGIDTNQFIRALNVQNSFFISTQFFYKHIKGAEKDEVLPVPGRYVQARDPCDPKTLQQTGVCKTANADPSRDPVEPFLRSFGVIEPILVHQSADQFLQTLFISTSYRSGTIEPSFTMFYDWSGALVYIPSVKFVFDPFRLTLEYNLLDAGTLKGNSGVSLLRDRDNFLFQVEYVI